MTRRARLIILSAVYFFGLPASSNARIEGPKRALIIGIDRYDPPNELQYADSDATHLYQVLTNPKVGGVDSSNAVFLSTSDRTPSDRLPVLANIRRELDKLAATPQQGGILWLYFSGHGVELNERSQIITQDLKPGESFTNYVIPVQYIRNQLQKACPTGIVVGCARVGSPRTDCRDRSRV